MISVDLAIAEIHLGVRFLELLENLLLLELIRRWQPHLFLFHIEEHLANCCLCFRILDVRVRRWFRVDFLRVDLRVASDRSWPPTILILPFLHSDVDNFRHLVVYLLIFENPERLLGKNLLVEFAID